MACRVWFSALLLGVLSSGCAAPAAPSAVPAAIRDDAFQPYREIATQSFEAAPSGGDRVRGHLAARRDRANGELAVRAVLGVVYVHKTGRHYETARNSRAEALPFRRLHRDDAACRRAMGCARAELFEVDVPLRDLQRALNAGDGYPIKMFSRAGDATLFPIPPALIVALFRGIDKTAPAVVANAPAPPR